MARASTSGRGSSSPSTERRFEGERQDAALAVAGPANLDVADLLQHWEIERASIDGADFQLPHDRWEELWRGRRSRLP
jgi:hypothetical protein